MAYFSNGSEGDYYQARYCDRCVNWRVRGEGEYPGCPVLDLHMIWNYDAVGRDADQTKRAALDALWPREGVHNGDCRMFFERPAPPSGQRAEGGE